MALHISRLSHRTSCSVSRPHIAPLRLPKNHPSHSRSLTSTRIHHASPAQPTDAHRDKDAPVQTQQQTHFGYQTIAESLKESRVGQVFSSVASSYDTMNDLMSLGIHRLWKDHFVRSLNPGSPNGQYPWHILDVAGGTGDIAFRILDHAASVHGDYKSRVTIADINPDMLAEGKKRAAANASAKVNANDTRLDFMQANAQDLSSIPSDSIDLYTVAFGIRNFTHKDAALREAFRVLKPGGIFACLEFSKLDQSETLNSLYKRWSFGAIPLIGQIVAGDRDSYQYLVESIEKFPSQKEWAGMIRDAGFVLPNDELDEALGRKPWENLSGGIAAIHKGIKPR